MFRLSMLHIYWLGVSNNLTLLILNACKNLELYLHCNLLSAKDVTAIIFWT